MIVTCPHCRSQLQVPEEFVAATLRCTQCQAQFRVGAGGAPEPAGYAAPPPMAVPADAWGPPPGAVAPGPARTSGAAIASLILGIVGLMCCLCGLGPCAGIPGGILGLVGFAAAGKPGRKGRGVAVAGIVLSTLAVLTIVPIIVVGFQYAKDIKCFMNMVAISQAVMTRHVSLEDLPENLNGHELLKEWAQRSGVDESALRCPKSGRPYRGPNRADGEPQPLGPNRSDGKPQFLAACDDHRLSGQDFIFAINASGQPQMTIRGHPQPGTPAYEEILDGTAP